MMTFFEIPALLQSGILVICTLLALAEIYCSIVCRIFKAEAGELFLNILLLVICVFYLTVFTEGHAFVSSGSGISPLSEAVCRLPAALTGATIFLLLFASCASVHRVNVWRRTNVTPMSIKQGTDKLPTGICCCDGDGKPMLTNHCMEKLCLKITGKPLLNAKVFWEELSEGDTVSGNTVIKKGDEPIIRLDTGEVRCFSKREMISEKRRAFEITAADVTEQYGLSSRLMASNAELEEIKNRLVVFSENVADITREKEVLAAKISIHNKLGTALLASKRYIQEDSPLDRKSILKIWQDSISFLEREAKQPESRSLDGLYDAARIMGLTLAVEGELPQGDNKTMRLIMSGARECITNAVHHADARKLVIRILSDSHFTTVEYTNDGIRPVGIITEGGGLSSLRREVEEKGGQMQIDCVSQFVLRLKIPKTGGGNNG